MSTLHRWQARIHIGRWAGPAEWRLALERRAESWLARPPAVPVSDSPGRVALDTLRGRRTSPAIRSWQLAGLVMGLGASAADEVAARSIDPATGDWREKPQHPDAAMLAQALKMHGALPEKAEQTTLEMVLALKGDGPTIPYRAALPTVRFVDTIGLAAPFLVAAGQADLAAAQIAEYDAALLPGTSIPAHAWDLGQSVPLGIYDWSRGAGWYALGLVGSNFEGRFDSRITALARDMLRFERPNGGWGAMFFNSHSPFESSGTAAIGLLMVAAHAIDPDPRLRQAAQKARTRLMAATRRDGALDMCQGDTLGPGVYSRTFSTMPFAQGLALRLAKELETI